MTAKVYRSGTWKRVRLRVLERDGWTCQVRGPKCKVTADEVDHIVPVSKGGSWYDDHNLRAACKPCNVGRARRHTVDNASAPEVIERLRALGLHDAAQVAASEAKSTGTPSRDW